MRNVNLFVVDINCWPVSGHYAEHVTKPRVFAEYPFPKHSWDPYDKFKAMCEDAPRLTHEEIAKILGVDPAKYKEFTLAPSFGLFKDKGAVHREWHEGLGYSVSCGWVPFAEHWKDFIRELYEQCGVEPLENQ